MLLKVIFKRGLSGNTSQTLEYADAYSDKEGQ